LLVGDVLFELDGRGVNSTDDLLDLLTSIAVGQPVSVRVLRGAVVANLTITVGERPAG
jgi:S1-C subfamily serine protease